ncbi:hypothetical protein C8R46DRAFT_1328211 [Mycena filopes]|nr:hypothetical protein C8R46DRAFT_1328211 [Mycena filopes]
MTASNMFSRTRCGRIVCAHSSFVSPLVAMESVLSDLQLVSYITAGSLTLLVYDTLLQIKEEYRHVWKSRWTVIKCLYLLTRYGTFISLIMSLVNLTEHWLPSPHSVPACNKVTTFTTAFSGSIVALTELILMLPTYTLYERSRKLLAFFFLLYPSQVSKLFKSLYCDGVWCYLAIWPFTIAAVVCLLLAPVCGSLSYDSTLNTRWKPGLRNLPADGPVMVIHSVLTCRLITHARAIAEKEDRRPYVAHKNTRLISDAVVRNMSLHNGV